LRRPHQFRAGVGERAELVTGQRGAVDDHGGQGERAQGDQLVELVDGALVVALAFGEVDVEGVHFPGGDAGEDGGQGVGAAVGETSWQSPARSRLTWPSL
jgi:hypothetical protein